LTGGDGEKKDAGGGGDDEEDPEVKWIYQYNILDVFSALFIIIIYIYIWLLLLKKCVQ
jgi:hypothetical protein